METGARLFFVGALWLAFFPFPKGAAPQALIERTYDAYPKTTSLCRGVSA